MPQDPRHFIAQRLRREMTDAERALWRLLRNGGAGLRFRRQEVIGAYVVDFICRRARLVVELDGGQHDQSTADTVRTAYLQQRGLRVPQFWNHEVLGNTDGVVRAILDAVRDREHPHPTLPLKEGEGP